LYLGKFSRESANFNSPTANQIAYQKSYRDNFDHLCRSEQFTEHYMLESILWGLSSSSCDGGSGLVPGKRTAGNYAHRDLWIAIVQNADSYSLFDNIDSGCDPSEGGH
jgi:hypothetical protein